MTPDTSIVDLHRLDGPTVVQDVLGRAHVFRDSGGAAIPLTVGETVEIGDTIALSAGTEVRVGHLLLGGGRQGRAHTFVKIDAFLPSPGRADVPRLLLELKRVESEIEALGRDPLATSELPSTPYARAVAEEFVTMNLNEQDSRELSADIAHRLRAIVVFVSEETAFVATSRVTVEKLIALMKALERPVQPHLVDDALIARLLDQVYGATPPDDVKL